MLNINSNVFPSSNKKKKVYGKQNYSEIESLKILRKRLLKDSVISNLFLKSYVNKHYCNIINYGETETNF